MGSFMFVVIIILASLGAIIAHLFTQKGQRTAGKRPAHHNSTTSTYTSYTHHASEASCGGDSVDSGGGCD